MGHYAPDSSGLLAPIQHWLADSEVSEILMNQPGEIYVEKYGKLQKLKSPGAKICLRAIRHFCKLKILHIFLSAIGK